MEASPQFQTTLWSLVLLAKGTQGESSRKALDGLCQTYWYPVYAHIRRTGVDAISAEDLAQGFFQQILTTGFLERVDAGRGRFRNYLLGALRHYLANEYDRRTALRRGGGRVVVSIDTELAENWLAGDSSHMNDAAQAFDRSWAETVIASAIDALQNEQEEAGKGPQFLLLKEYLQRSALPGEYESVGSSLKITKGAVAATVHRLNERLGELVRKSVRETLADPAMADEEMRCLFAALHS